MRKIVLFIAALLFMAVPVMAVSHVTISCADDDINMVTVSYTSDTNLIRAFGLDITTDTNKITKVVVMDANYRIYPGQIVIVDGNVTDYNTPYAPGDLGDANVTIEMGSLYTTDSNYASDPNAGYNKKPGKSGTLLKFYVGGDCNYVITENAIRCGIVMEDPYEVPNVTLCSGQIKSVPTNVTISGRIIGSAAPKSTTGIGGVTMGGLTGVVTDATGNYTGTVSYGWSGTVTPSKTQWTFSPVNRVYSSITSNQTGQNYTGTALECLASTDPGYTAWKNTWSKPNCWCYRKQCKGDINGTPYLNKRVTQADNDILKAAYNKTDAQLALVTNGICADLNHTAYLSKRVTQADNDILKVWYNVVDASVPECDSTNINFWTN